MAVATAEKRREGMILVKVWEPTVRVTHWLLFLSITTLCITGYLIGNPTFSSPQEAAKTFTFGTIRFLHFAAAYVLLATFLIRLYWGFVGNRYARWSTLLPITGKRWRAIWKEVLDLALPKGKFRVYTGHSPLANVFYVLVYLAVLFSLVSGFTMYGAAHYTPFWRTISAWGLALFGNNLNTVHFWHHWLLWFFILFFLMHLYLVIYTIVVSRTTEIDTMISGYKFVVEETLSEEAE
ncbi:MAG: Ni/Fe-hydrogenase, b-type cytochrome subunit [Calditrichaeota bacterium]|nr:MAG: Ni/Fe-hydrogenase, b-type cytochrome subunit [Calditrichota bacterium]